MATNRRLLENNAVRLLEGTAGSFLLESGSTPVSAGLRLLENGLPRQLENNVGDRMLEGASVAAFTIVISPLVGIGVLSHVVKSLITDTVIFPLSLASTGGLACVLNIPTPDVLIVVSPLVGTGVLLPGTTNRSVNMAVAPLVGIGVLLGQPGDLVVNETITVAALQGTGVMTSLVPTPTTSFTHVVRPLASHSRLVSPALATDWAHQVSPLVGISGLLGYYGKGRGNVVLTLNPLVGVSKLPRVSVLAEADVLITVSPLAGTGNLPTVTVALLTGLGSSGIASSALFAYLFY